MPIPMGILFDLRNIFYKIAILFGVLIVVYAVLWILAELNLIPSVFFAIFPQILLLLIGIFIIYLGISSRKSKY
jgi:hypothetical protein